MIGIILINFGGPRSREDIRPFLEDIFCDVLPRPLKFLAPFIARLRETYAQKMYAAIGGASPVVGWTVKQAVALETKSRDFHVYAGMKYGRPSISDAIEEANADGCKKIILLPLFPYQSRYTQIPSNLNTQTLKHLNTSPLYISAMVDIIKTKLADWKDIPPPNIDLLFSVHAIPLSSAKKEPYIRQIHESISKIMEHFTGYNFHIAFQSQAGPIRWTGPNVKTTLKSIRLHAYTPARLHVLFVPLGFACENIETLYEIDQLYVPYAKSLGIENIARTPALNDHPQFIDLLKELVLNYK